MPNLLRASFQVFSNLLENKIVENFIRLITLGTIKNRSLQLLFIFFINIHASTIAQNKFSIGISFAPGGSFTTLSKETRQRNLKGTGTYFNYHLSTYGQFLFKDKFGLETGVGVATKSAALKIPGQNYPKEIYLDAFHFPFLLCYKLPFKTTPYKKWLFLAGTTIEYQKNISKNTIALDEEKAHFVPNLSLGSRIDFKQGSLGKIQLGLSFQYAFKSYYTYNLELEESFIKIKPRVHYLKLDIIYFFFNKDLF